MSESSRSMGTLGGTGTLSKYDKPKFKRCTIKLESNNNFGFTLNSKVKPKYMIFAVEPASPAYAANLRTSDVIVGIDGKNIRRLKFDKVKQMLSDSRKNGQVEILAISKEGYLYYKNKKKRFSSTKLVTSDNTELYSYPVAGGIRTREISSDNGKELNLFE
jgi:C-terminal processing protease CtpA/Prc